MDLYCALLQQPDPKFWVWEKKKGEQTVGEIWRKPINKRNQLGLM